VSADLVAFRLKPKTSGAWSSAVLAGAAAVDRFLLGEFLAAYARDLEPACRPAGAHAAAAAMLGLSASHPELAVLCEAVLVALMRQALACDRPN
jgi:hypothetical protein